MAVKIFDVENESKPQFADDVVGRFRSGTQINGRPMALDAWRITTGDPDVAASVQSLMGGDEPQEWETKTEETLEVFTETDSVEVIFDGPNAVKSSMALWGRNGLIHACDGETTTEGKPCPQAGMSVAERKEAARAGHGCEPSIQAYFRLAQDPDLGKFKFFSGSWTLLRDINAVEEKLTSIDGEARATLSLEHVEFTTKSGENRSFTRPVIKVLGAA